MTGSLDGSVILIIEDELLIALDLELMLADHGAQTVTVNSLVTALTAVEAPEISAAIVDHVLGDGDSSDLYRRLAERGVPFLIHTAKNHLTGPCTHAERLDKPTSPEVLLAAVQRLLTPQANSNGPPTAVAHHGAHPNAGRDCTSSP